MKLAVSNIAWNNEDDEDMYAYLESHGYSGLEIAPTRLFPDSPYERLKEAKALSKNIKKDFGLAICSIQSIWYGLTNNIFGTEEDRLFLIEYSKKAIDFSEAVGCRNIVFGSPKNRRIPAIDMEYLAVEFFKVLGDYAAERDIMIALEPNPPCYGTNFINTTQEAISFCERVGSLGLKTNLDLGACIFNGETIEFMNENINKVNHIHISEPMLAPIVKRQLHYDLKKLKYTRFISVEMKNNNNISELKNILKYIGETLL